MRQVLQLNGYRVIDTDNGQDAARNARQTRPDLLVVDMDVPLLYGLVAARQIIKNARVGPLPVVIVTHEDVVDPAPMMEARDSRTIRNCNIFWITCCLFCRQRLTPRLLAHRISARLRQHTGKEVLLRMSCHFPNKAFAINLLLDVPVSSPL
ncbi:MAG: response regulator [Pyrinomonadaceae bacterium]